MNDERLLDLIAAYGADPMAWPDAERTAAETHLAAHPARFETALAEARLLDQTFARVTLPEEPAGLSERILASAPAAPTAGARGGGFLQDLRGLVFPNGVRWPASATVAALVMGLVAGVATAPATAGNSYSTDEEQVVYSALGYDSFEAYMQEVDG